MKAVATLMGMAWVLLCQAAWGEQYSALWGKNGESWNKARLPDFTHAGYKQGLSPIPDFATVIDVKTYGAKGDGVADDTKAFRSAIKNCPANATLLIPAGTYLLSDTLIIGKSGLAIKGESRAASVLYFSKGLQQLYPRGLTADPAVWKTPWSWEGAMILFKGKITNSGIANLTVRFPDSAYGGHNFHERGYNGIGFANGAKDGWISGVTLINCDLGIYLRDVTQITAMDWSLEFLGARQAQKLGGHHGVNCYARYNLFYDFEIKGRYVHALSVEEGAEAAAYNVFSRGSGMDLNFDHHNSGNGMINTNLWTDMDVGAGTDIYASGGDSGGYWWQSETFWNVYGPNAPIAPNDLGPKAHDCNFVATAAESARKTTLSGTNQWVERIDPAQISPRDIYWAQMKVLHGITPDAINRGSGFSGIRNASGRPRGGNPRGIACRAGPSFKAGAGWLLSPSGSGVTYGVSGRTSPLPR